MKEVILTQGKVAFVDDEDYESVSENTWRADCVNGKWYAVRQKQVNRISKKIYMHRQIMNAPKGMEVDHIDGNGLDNRKDNMRVVTHNQNMKNKKVNSNNKWGYTGVHFSGRDRVFQAYIQNGKHHVYLGKFDNPVSAAIAYNEAATKYFGEYARLNVIKETL